MTHSAKAYIKLLPACPQCRHAGIDGLYCSDCKLIINPDEVPFFSVEINNEKLYMRFTALNLSEVEKAVKAINDLIGENEKEAELEITPTPNDDMINLSSRWVTPPPVDFKNIPSVKFKRDTYDPFAPVKKDIRKYDFELIKSRIQTLLAENKPIFSIAEALNNEGELKPKRDSRFTYNNVKAFINSHIGTIRDIKAANARSYFEKLRSEQRAEVEKILFDCIVTKKWDNATIKKYFEEAKYLNNGEGFKITDEEISEFKKGLNA